MMTAWYFSAAGRSDFRRMSAPLSQEVPDGFGDVFAGLCVVSSVVIFGRRKMRDRNRRI